MAWDNEINEKGKFGGKGVFDAKDLRRHFNRSLKTATNVALLANPVTAIPALWMANNDLKNFSHNAKWNARGGVPTAGAVSYPFDMDTNQDHIEIDEFEYRRPNTGSNEGDVVGNAMDHANAGGPGATTSAQYAYKGTILLPMPKVNDNNQTNWGINTLDGTELNALNRASVRRGLGFGQRGRDDQQMRDADNQGNRGRRGSGTGKGRSDNQTWYVPGRELAINAKKVQENMGGAVSASSALARTRGQILNPNAELLFEGPVLRSHSFAWIMIARSQAEGKRIREIIKRFKTGMAPRWNNTMLLETPHIWELQYKRGSTVLDTANRFKQVALTECAVDYAPDTFWTSYEDSQPIAVRMQLTFKELRAIYQTDQESAPETSVGY